MWLENRIPVLWTCIGLFFLRVTGQIEALLLEPDWLPSMDAWYSGLLPYPLLLPLQILILMLMSVLAFNEGSRVVPVAARARRWVRHFAIGYFCVMVLRLAIQLFRGAEDVIAAGGIPVMFHWVLALFLLVWAGGRIAARNSLNAGSSAH
jgi:hypothetical protein